MKKQAAIIMAAVLAVSALTACGSSSSSETTAAATEAATEAAADTEEDTEDADTATETEAAEEGSTIVSADPDLGYNYQDLELGDGSLDRVLAAGKIVVGTSPDFAPWEFEDVSSGTTEYAGSDMELAKYIAEKIGVELEIKPMEFSAILQALQSGTVDLGISGFAYTEERNEALGLSHYYNIARDSGQGLLVPADLVHEYDTAESFAGKRIALQNASLQYNLAVSQLPDDIDIQLITNITDGVMMLTTGKVDAMGVAEDNGISLSEAYPEVAMADFYYDYAGEGNVLGVRKGDNDLLNAVNDIIDEVNDLGLYEQWKAEATELARSLGIDVD